MLILIYYYNIIDTCDNAEEMKETNHVIKFIGN